MFKESGKMYSNGLFSNTQNDLSIQKLNRYIKRVKNLAYPITDQYHYSKIL
jgi:hypothetical protein